MLTPDGRMTSVLAARAALRHGQGRRRQDDRRRSRSASPPPAPAGARSCCARSARRRRAPRLFGVAAAPPGRSSGWPRGCGRRPSTRTRALEEWATRVVGSRRLVGVLARSNAFRRFVAAAPGARELVSITKAWELGQRGALDPPRAPVRPRRRRRPGLRPRRRAAAHAPHVRRDRARRADRDPGAAVASCSRTRRARAWSPSPRPPRCRSARRSSSRTALHGALGRGLDRSSSTACCRGASARTTSSAVASTDGALPAAVVGAVRSQAGQAAVQQAPAAAAAPRGRRADLDAAVPRRPRARPRRAARPRRRAGRPPGAVTAETRSSYSIPRRSSSALVGAPARARARTGRGARGCRARARARAGRPCPIALIIRPPAPIRMPFWESVSTHDVRAHVVRSSRRSTSSTTTSTACGTSWNVRAQHLLADELGEQDLARLVGAVLRREQHGPSGTRPARCSTSAATPVARPRGDREELVGDVELGGRRAAPRAVRARSRRSTLLTASTTGDAGAAQRAGDEAVARADALLAVDHEQRGVGLCRARARRAAACARSARRAGAARRAGRRARSAHRRPVATPRIARRVVCGLSETIATLRPTIALTSVDLPTFGRPARATKPARVVGSTS